MKLNRYYLILFPFCHAIYELNAVNTVMLMLVYVL
jgi:hypothetical protein